MTNKAPSVLVAMSGGVDSSVAAALLLERGYHVQGVFMHVGQARGGTDEIQAGQAAENDARRVADHLGIELHVVDMRSDMAGVIQYFIDEYRRGRTPNPCVMCNRHLKFGALLDLSRRHGLDHFTTGHYARVEPIEGAVRLRRGLDWDKDQSYALFVIRPQFLPRVILPLGAFNKTEVREIAKARGLPIHAKQESQEICFVPDDDYITFVEQHAPDLAQPGQVVDTSGKVLGEHQGVFRYTIGQRRGLGIALGEPAYVVRLDATEHTVVLGGKDDLMQSHLLAKNVNWLVDPVPTEPFEATVQIRYNHRGAAAQVVPQADQTVEVCFASTVPAITPGQAAVFYDEHQAVIGGGWIDRGY